MNLATGKLLSCNETLIITSINELFLSGDDVVIKGHVEIDDVRPQYTFLNWACKAFYYLLSKQHQDFFRLYQTEGKLGYETMSYSGQYQLNNFFSRRTKKVLLKTTHQGTYD